MGLKSFIRSASRRCDARAWQGERIAHKSDAIVAEQARYLHRNLPATLCGSMLGAICIAFVFRNSADATLLGLWLAAFAVHSLWRFVTWRRSRPVRSPADASRWLRMMVIGAGIPSALWGLGALYILPMGTGTEQFAFLCAVVLLAIASVFNYGCHYPTFLSVFLPFSLAAMISIAMNKTVVDPVLSVILLIFITVMLYTGRHFNRVMLDTLGLRFENLGLVTELRAQKDAAEAASSAKSRFLAVASHDLRQPMHALDLYLGLLANFELPAAGQAQLRNARQCAQAMKEMFRDLLDLSRLSSGAMQPSMREFPIWPVLTRVLVQFEPEAQARRLRLRIAPCAAIVRSDPAIVERMVSNLVANAVRYTDRGGVLIACRRRGARLRVAVFDTGPGIPAEKQRAVFEEFYQIQRSDPDRAKGLGLGLAIVDRLAKLIDSKVRLRSVLRKGSTFAFDLPYVATGTTKPAPRTEVALDPAAMRDVQVVVIDDDEAILHATRALLEHWRCRVLTATSGAEALARLAGKPVPDVLICDYRLRDGECGLDAVLALRRHFRRTIPALLITGDTAPELLRELESDNLPVLHKPIEADELKPVLLALLPPRTTNRSGALASE